MVNQNPNIGVARDPDTELEKSQGEMRELTSKVESAKGYDENYHKDFDEDKARTIMRITMNISMKTRTNTTKKITMRMKVSM